MSLVHMALINWLLKLKMHGNTFFFWIFLYENTIWNFLYFWKTWSYAWKQDFFFFVFPNIVFATFQRKSGILILDLYFYIIKIQTNINKKLVEKYMTKPRIF